jgi:phytoene dehydrogenase-like protein
MNQQLDVIIVGAGVAGLSCARRLHQAGRSFLLCDGADRVGGRVATDLHEGFRLDRGFQVLLTAYPEARKQLDYEALQLRHFYAGALVRFGGEWHRVADPFRHPVDGLRGVFNPIGSLADKIRVGLLRLRGFRFPKQGPGVSAFVALRSAGFSESIIERFFRPFLGGVFLENELVTTASKLEFVMRFFAQGDTAVPALGMGEIPQQLAASLPASSLRLGTRVASVDESGVTFENGERVNGRNVVIATDLLETHRLLGDREETPAMNSVSCLYFSAPSAPVDEAMIVLNGDGHGPINNLSVMSSAEYTPPGRHLISVSVVDREAVGAPDLEERVRRQLVEWFGAGASDWPLLRIYRIPGAVPSQPVFETRQPCVRQGIYVCGDHCGIASLNTALASGRLAAEAILKNS